MVWNERGCILRWAHVDGLARHVLDRGHIGDQQADVNHGIAHQGGRDRGRRRVCDQFGRAQLAITQYEMDEAEPKVIVGTLVDAGVGVSRGSARNQEIDQAVDAVLWDEFVANAAWDGVDRRNRPR